MYCPYKAIGYVTDGNPFSINRLGNETFLTTSIGKSFQVYKLDHLRVCLVSKITNDNITCIETSGHETYVAVKNDIIVYNRTDIVRTYKKHKSNILGLLIVGNILLSYDIDNYLVIIDINERSIIDNIHLIQNSTITSIIHPDTYINKFLIGFH
jgi:U3 small nucleolar RNA-associated protein 21